MVFVALFSAVEKRSSNPLSILFVGIKKTMKLSNFLCFPNDFIYEITNRWRFKKRNSFDHDSL